VVWGEEREEGRVAAARGEERRTRAAASWGEEEGMGRRVAGLWGGVGGGCGGRREERGLRVGSRESGKRTRGAEWKTTYQVFLVGSFFLGVEIEIC
jgi:hypothetical protein